MEPSGATRLRRRRAALLLAIAVACGALAASGVRHRLREIDSQIAPLVPVVVAVEDIRAHVRLDPGRVSRSLELRRVPQRFAPSDSLASLDQVLGLRTLVPVRAGAFLTSSEVASEGAAAAGARSLRPGERALEVPIAGPTSIAALGGPGARVDVLVTRADREGPGSASLALEDVELLGLRRGGADSGPDGAPAATATLRLTLRQALSLSAAQASARELRLLPRPPGDHARERARTG